MPIHLCLKLYAGLTRRDIFCQYGRLCALGSLTLQGPAGETVVYSKNFRGQLMLQYWDLYIFLLCLAFVVFIYFKRNPLKHSRRFMMRRFINWFPLGMTYAFLYMARYNLNVSKESLGSMMTKEDFGLIFGAGTFTYALSFFLNGPLVDKIGGKKGILVAALGASLMNALMGVATYLFMHGRLGLNLTVTFSVLYSLNMFFQSYGAVSIIKVKAYWFHVRERGVFGAIFGTLISFGAYFAFDWGRAIANAAKVTMTTAPNAYQKFIRSVFAVDTGTVDANWLIFFIPAFILIFWALLDVICIKDSPDQAGFDDFDTHDASSDTANEPNPRMLDIIKKTLSHPVILIVCLVEFTSGVLRNGIMQWYLVFQKEVPGSGAEFFTDNWGILIALSGMLGGFSAGYLSDRFFHSRRAPPAAIMSAVMLVCALVMSLFLFKSPFVVGLCSVMIIFAVIGVHSIMSGTAAADFGGKKATATASGLTDACVYFGTGIQSVSLGYLTTLNWQYWPAFLVPFTLLGILASVKIWAEIPAATRRYLATIEKVSLRVSDKKQKLKSAEETAPATI